MEYEGMGTSITLKEKIGRLMEQSTYLYKKGTKTYSQLKDDEEASPYFNRKYEKILKWINFIFERFENNKIPQEISCFVLDEYSREDCKKIKSMITEDIIKIARLYLYFLEIFFGNKIREHRKNGKTIHDLLKKVSSETEWDFYERHDYIEHVYNRIWDEESEYFAEQEVKAENPRKDISDCEIRKLVDEKKKRIQSELDDYFTYEKAIALFLDDFMDIKVHKIENHFFESNQEYEKIKSYFSKIVELYRALYTKMIDYNEELEIAEEELLEIIFDLIESECVKNESDLANGKWEVIDLEIREDIISCIDKIYQCGEDVINKYIGAVTSEELKIKMERIKYKLRNPLICRILIKLEDIKTEVQVATRLKANISDDTKFEESKTLQQIEKNLDTVLKLITEKNSKIFDCLDDTMILFGENCEF